MAKKKLRSSHKKTLGAIFQRPARADVAWRDICSLFEALGARVTEGKGSRVRVRFPDSNVIGHFHAPHGKHTPKSILESVRQFLSDTGVSPP